MRSPGLQDDHGYVGGATHATTLVEWDIDREHDPVFPVREVEPLRPVRAER